MNISEGISFKINDEEELERVIHTGVKFDEGYILPSQTFNRLFDFIEFNEVAFGSKDIKAYFDIVSLIAGNQKTNSKILKRISYKQKDMLINLCNNNIIRLKQEFVRKYSDEKQWTESTPNIFELIISNYDDFVFIPIAAGISTTITSKVQENLKKNKMVYHTLMNVELEWRNAIIENLLYLKSKNLDKADLNTRFSSRVNNIFRSLTTRSMKTGNKVKRVYSTLTLLTSESRKHLHMNGQYFNSIDLVNAQPTILVKLIDSLGLPIDDEYVDVVSDGQFYESIMNYAAENDIYEDGIYDDKTEEYERFDFSDRDQVKVLCYRGVFFYQHENKHIWKIFSELYPKTAGSIKDIKAMDSEVTLASRLQNMEAEIFHNIFLDSPYFIVHDAIYYTDISEKESIYSQIESNFGENMANKYDLKDEDVDPKGRYTSKCKVSHYEGNIILSVKTKNKPHKKHNLGLVLAIEELLDKGYKSKEIYEEVGEEYDVTLKTIRNNITDIKKRAA